MSLHSPLLIWPPLHIAQPQHYNLASFISELCWHNLGARFAETRLEHTSDSQWGR